ncbi:MAG: GAF domain-containing protein [Chloroflexi bacterium]|nr:GAF domain-containing protein [Chloroflexota bacterium]
MSLKKKAGLYGGVGLLILVGVLAFLGMRAIDKSTQRSLDERVLIAQTVAQSVDQILSKALDDLEQFAALQAYQLGDRDPAPEIHAVDEFYRWSRTLTPIFLLDREGKVIHTQPPYPELVGKPLTDDPRAMANLKKLLPYVSGTLAINLTQTRVFTVAVPVVGEKRELLGVVGGSVDLSRGGSTGLIDPMRLGKTAYAEIVDEDGWVMATTKSQPEAASTEETEYAAHFATLVKARQATQETCYRCHATEKGIERRRDVLAFAPLTIISGGAAIRQSEEEALAPSQELLRDMLLSGGLISLLGIGLIWIATQGLVRPIVQLTAASRRISEGEFDTEIATTRADELGELAFAFDQMRLKLRDSIEQREERAQESEKRAQQLSSLNAVAAIVSRPLDLDRVLGDGLEEALRILGLATGGIWLKEEEPPQLTLKTYRGASRQWLEGIARLQQEPGVSVVVLPYQDATSPSSEEPSSFVYVPLVSKGKVLGAMGLASPGQHQFDPQERELLAAFGHQLGVGIENAQLFQESQRREREAHTLNRIAMDISRLLDLNKILDTVVESARQVLGADAAMLSLWDNISGDIYVKAVSGSVSPAFTELRLGIGEGIAGKVLSQGRPVISEDYANDPDIIHTREGDDLVRKDGLKAHLVVPLKIGEVILGSLGIANKQAQPFREREVDLLQQLANQAAVAIENARLYAQVEEMAVLQERQRIAREMHDGLGQVLAYLRLKSRELQGLLASNQTTQAQEGVAEVKEVVDSAYEEVRGGVLALRAQTPSQAGLIPLLKDYVEGFQSQTGNPVALIVADERATQFPPRVAIQLVRVIQEALANVRKHAQASKVEVSFEVVDEQALITVEDDGVGFDPTQMAFDSPFHFGLQTMKERMESVGGSLTTDSRPGSGTRIIGKLPLSMSR